MRILIIGSEGFIGRNLSSFFSHREIYNVFKADISEKKEENYFKIDKDNENFFQLFQNNTFDVCINASGSGSVAFSNENPKEDKRLNTVNVLLMLEAMKRYNASCKFVNFSSAAVYGNSVKQPISENDELKPVSPYGEHKLQSEIICSDFFTKYKIPTLSLRVFSVYGPGLEKQLLWDIFQKSKTGKQIQLGGTGNETRDFIYIDDLCEAVEKLLLRMEFRGQAVNVASGKSTTIKDVFDLLISQIANDHTAMFNNITRVGDPIHYLADITTLKSTGFFPKHSIQEGIKKYASWLRERK